MLSIVGTIANTFPSTSLHYSWYFQHLDCFCWSLWPCYFDHEGLQLTISKFNKIVFEFDGYGMWGKLFFKVGLPNKQPTNVYVLI
jgi:hypothetical protein